ncbi:MAG: N-acetylmuramoyl-L-alanine amidase, partial [Micrococcales bacterium]|nr:N-acetylmuramoyl-L-alanine amidase [Micrococcales bacterium]
MSPRPSLRLTSLLAAAAAALVLPVATTGPTSAHPAAPEPVQTSMRSISLTGVATANPTARTRTPRPVAQSGVVDVSGRVHVVGLTWPRGEVADSDVVEIRERTGSAWGAWTTMDHDGGDGPDPGTAEATHSRSGTDPWVTTADAVQVRVRSTGAAPSSAKLDVVDPGDSPADTEAPTGAGAAAAQGVRPTIYTRAQWGADESMRGRYFELGVVKAAVVHHTAGSNNYTAAQVPAIIRGIYRYHVTGNGWSDIGYNFLIDKFGRIWEGRWGGIDRPVVGAHALGVNSQTYGASIIGDYTSTVPSSAAITAQAKLAAWKLGLSHVDPTATTTLTGYGTKYTINGHRDTYSTSCPGAQVYSRLPTIRSLARTYQGTMFYDPTVSAASVPYGGGGVTVRSRASTALSWRITVTSPCRAAAVATVTGTASAGQTFSAVWNGRLSTGEAAPPGTYSVTMTAANGSGPTATATPVTYPLTVRTAAGAPAGFCPPRLAGSNRYAVAVATSRVENPTSRTVVLVNGTEQAVADALVAAPLARHLGGVLLLTYGSTLAPETAAEITRRGATTVHVVGGEGSVSPAVVAQLRSLGVTTIERTGGADRYEVAAGVAHEIAPAGSSAVFVAGGTAVADGLGVSGPA